MYKLFTIQDIFIVESDKKSDICDAIVKIIEKKGSTHHLKVIENQGEKNEFEYAIGDWAIMIALQDNHGLKELCAAMNAFANEVHKELHRVEIKIEKAQDLKE
jgi:hypothetical protein